MYTCGITPYDSTHLGHAATYLTYDVLQRRLRDLGHDTRCVRNITDVDDSILGKARELGVHYLDLAAAEMARFDADMDRLDMIPPWSEPRATCAIADIRGFIGMVLDAGLRLPGRRCRLLRGGQVPEVRAGLALQPRRDARLRRRARRQRRRSQQARPARLRPLAAVAGRRAGVGLAVGSRSTGLAHRVLGAVPPRARHDHRPARRGSRPDLPAPRVRGRPVRGRHRGAAGASLDAPGDGRGWTARRCRSRWATSCSCPTWPRTFDPRAIRLARDRPPLPRGVGVERPRSCRTATERLAGGMPHGAGSGALDEVRGALDDDLSTPRPIEAIDVAAAEGARRERGGGPPGRRLDTEVQSPS